MIPCAHNIVFYYFFKTKHKIAVYWDHSKNIGSFKNIGFKLDGRIYNLPDILNNLFQFDPAALSKIFHEQYADEFDDNVGVDYFLDYFSHQNSQDNAPRNTAAFSSCSQSDLKKLNVQSFGAILKCPGSQDSVSHQSECSWSCTKGAFIKESYSTEFNFATPQTKGLSSERIHEENLSLFF